MRWSDGYNRLMKTNAVTLIVTALLLCGCGNSEGPEPPSAAITEPATAPPYKPVASNVELMRSIITVAAEEYWGSVSIIVDANGITENAPESDDEWRLVWAAGISLAESGNLLMMPTRAVDNEDWMRYSEDLVDVGLQAARAAEARDADAVLEVGELVYNVCLDCHRDYVPRLPDL
jgi:hypothetical protein